MSCTRRSEYQSFYFGLVVVWNGEMYFLWRLVITRSGAHFAHRISGDIIYSDLVASDNIFQYINNYIIIE